MQRVLKTQTTASVMFAKDSFREAARVGLIDQAEPWFELLKARNLTSHTYNESTANETYQVAKRFLPEVEKLLRSLERISHGSTRSLPKAICHFGSILSTCIECRQNFVHSLIRNSNRSLE